VPSHVEQVRKRLAASIEKHRSALRAFEELLKDPNPAAGNIDRAQRELKRLAAEHAHLLAEWRLATASERLGGHAGLAGQRPLREQVLDVLEEIGVPASPRVISEVAAARYGCPLPVARFASLRRDEERAWRKDPLSRPAWVVPALSAQGLTAIPRIVASSAWPPERRLIGARTLRTNHLLTLLALLKACDRAAHADDTRALEHLRTIVISFAQTVPGALEPGAMPDHDRIRKASELELGHIELLDLKERQAAAARLKRLPELQQLWGQPLRERTTQRAF
jgi:hypothetical protein